MWQRKILALLLLSPVVAVLGTAAASASAGVGIAPGKLHFESGSQNSTQSLYVINTGTQRSTYEVFAEVEFADWFQIHPATFALEPDQSKEVKISVTHPESAVGEHATRIFVTAFAQSAEDQLGTGVKVPALISIDSNGLQNGAGIEVPAHISVSSNIAKGKADMARASGESMGTRLWIYIPSAIAALLAAIILFMLYRRKHLV